MYIANSTGGLMLQTMLYLANQTSKVAVNSLMDMPPADKIGGKFLESGAIFMEGVSFFVLHNLKIFKWHLG